MIDGQQHGTARVFHCNYFIELERDAQCWRVIAITHCLNGLGSCRRPSTILTEQRQNSRLEPPSARSFRRAGRDRPA
jgi:hypothetical protein